MSENHIELLTHADHSSGEVSAYDELFEGLIGSTEFKGYRYLDGIRTWEWFLESQEAADSALIHLTEALKDRGIRLVDSIDTLTRGTAWLTQT